MNEAENRGTAGEAIFGIFFIFIVLIFLLYRFGTNKETVANENIPKDGVTKEEFLSKLNDPTSESEIYNRYIKQIYETQTGKTDDGEVVNTEVAVDKIVEEYQKELQQKVALPTQTVNIKIVSDVYPTTSYRNDFEKIFEELKKAGGTTESQIFAAQITGPDTLLPLSDYDRETILRTATEYEIFVDKLVTLTTPRTQLKKVNELAIAALNVSYILRKLVEENDQKIYSLWITKYAENMSVIITNRYGLQ